MRPMHQSPEAYYRHLSPQLAAWNRQMWSQRGFDLDRIWGHVMGGVAGIDSFAMPEAPADSRPFDQLYLFDQGLIWLNGLQVAARRGQRASGGGLALAPAQFGALAIITARLSEELAALRLLVLGGLTMPAMQIARHVSEDIDMALVVLVQRRIAERFVACRTAEDANTFWRNHIAGGRAFRAVAARLYEVGLDYSDKGAYGAWRREVLTLLGTAVHTSALELPGQGMRPAPWPANDTARECLGYVTQRLQEMCAYSHVLDTGLQADCDRIGAEDPRSDAIPGRLIAFTAHATEILVAQMRWLMADRDAPERIPATGLH